MITSKVIAFAMLFVIFSNLQSHLSASQERETRHKVQHKIGRRERACREMAAKLSIKESNSKDIYLFKTCIADYFGFRINRNNFLSQPSRDKGKFGLDFRFPVVRRYIAFLAKRIERFFIRNGSWRNLLSKKKLFDPEASRCQTMLYIGVARYVYALYVFNSVRSSRGIFLPCSRLAYSKYELPTVEGACFVQRKHEKIYCAQQIEFSILGHNSGSLTAQFNQFFNEPLGEDRTVPGFKKHPDEMIGARVVAFHLEHKLPYVFKSLGYRDVHLTTDTSMKLCSIVGAIYRMKVHNAKYFNELLSDQSPLRANTPISLAFQHWTVELMSFQSKIEIFMKTPQYNYDLNFRRRYNIAFELVLGRLENGDDIPADWVNPLAQTAMVLVYNVSSYITTGAVIHSVVNDRYRKVERFLNVDVLWPSMLENWVMANREYNSCRESNYELTKCLLRMSKSLYLMLDAMVKLYEIFKKNKEKEEEELQNFAKLVEITKTWRRYKKKGYTSLPTGSTKKNFGYVSRQRKILQTPGFDEIKQSAESEMIGNEPTNEPAVVTPHDKNEMDFVDFEKTDRLTKGVESSLEKQRPTKNIEDLQEEKLLTKNFEDTHKAKHLERQNDDSSNDRPLAENDHASVDSKPKIENGNNHFFDAADVPDDIISENGSFHDVKPIYYVDVEQPTELGVERSLQDEEINNFMKYLHEPMELGKNTAESSATMGMNDDNQQMEELGSDSSMKHSENDLDKQHAGSSTTTPLDKQHAGSSITTPLDNEMTNTEFSQMDKLLDNKSEKSAGSSTPKSKENGMMGKIAGSEMKNDVGEATIKKPLDDNMEHTADSDTEETISQHDDFAEREEAHVIPRKNTKFGKNRMKVDKSGLKFSSSTSSKKGSFGYRRIRYSTTPDETSNIRTFMGTFRCIIGLTRDAIPMKDKSLTQECLNKIHQHVRVYNRAAFSRAAKTYKLTIHSGHSDMTASSDDDFLVKTEL